MFDGATNHPYVERDRVGPLGVLGRAQVRAEQGVLESGAHALVVRTSSFFGPWDDKNFLTASLRAVGLGIPVALPDDRVVSPTIYRISPMWCSTFFSTARGGSGHLANRGSTTLADWFARRRATPDSMPRSCMDVRRASWVVSRTRPAQAALASERGSLMPSLADAVRAYMAERQPPGWTNVGGDGSRRGEQGHIMSEYQSTNA